MSTVVNLNQVRKARARYAAEKAAADNRVKHGTPKTLRKQLDADKKQTKRKIDGKQLDKKDD